jgi:IS30 family transposase
MAQLTKVQRKELEHFLDKDYSYTDIGKMIGKDKSVISREVKRNSVNGTYDAEKAHLKSYQRRHWVMTDPQKIRTHKELSDYIEQKLLLRHPWSPETIAGVWNLKEAPIYGYTISVPTIYKYLYRFKPELCQYLCFKRTAKKRRKKKGVREMIPQRTAIHERPTIVEQRTRIGDWEGDTIQSIKEDKTSILVLHDRSSRYIRVSKSKDITKRRMVPKVRKLLKGNPQHTLTLDNGIEFKGHQSFGIETYFCDPYSSWQKGAVEYSNRLLRRHFPKKTRLENISPRKLALVVEALNNTPRKCLNWKTPNEVFHQNQFSFIS